MNDCEFSLAQHLINIAIYTGYNFITQIVHLILLFKKLLSWSTNDVYPMLAQPQQDSFYEWLWFDIGKALYQYWLPSKQPTAKVPRLAQASAKLCLVCGRFAHCANVFTLVHESLVSSLFAWLASSLFIVFFSSLFLLFFSSPVAMSICFSVDLDLQAFLCLFKWTKVKIN